MPVKAIVFSVVIVTAVGLAIYENREHVSEFVNRARRKIAASLHSFADGVSPDGNKAREQEIPFSGRSFGPEPGRRKSSDIVEKSPFGDENEVVEASGYAGRGQDTFVRHRGVGAGGEVLAGESSVLFDNSPAHDDFEEHQNEKIMAPSTISTVSSRRSSIATLNVEKPLPPPPAPAPPAPEESPFESGYESLATAAEPEPAGSTSSRTMSDVPALPARSPFENSQPYWSIHEWAENTADAPPSSSPSLAGSASGDVDAISDLASEFGSAVESVHSWTEVGSEVSDDH